MVEVDGENSAQSESDDRDREVLVSSVQ